MSGRHRVLKYFVTAIASLLLAGCGGDTYLVREAPYIAPSPPAPDETLICVFRENSSFGAARKFAIINNDTVIGGPDAGHLQLLLR